MAEPGPVRKNAPFHFWYVILAALGVVLIQDLWTQWSSVAHIPYSEFQSLLEQGKVEEVEIGADEIRGKLAVVEEGGKSAFVTTRVEPELAGRLEEFGVSYSGRKTNTFRSPSIYQRPASGARKGKAHHVGQ